MIKDLILYLGFIIKRIRGDFSTFRKSTPQIRNEINDLISKVEDQQSTKEEFPRLVRSGNNKSARSMFPHD